MVILFFPNLGFINSFLIILAFHTIYEIADFYKAYFLYYKKNTYLADNSFINSIGDTFYCIFGIIVSYYLLLKTNNRLIYPVFLTAIYVISSSLMYISRDG
jgi:hypothetical protein